MLVAPLHHQAYAHMPTKFSPLSPLSPNAIQLNAQQPARYGMTGSDSDSYSSATSQKQQSHSTHPAHSKRAIKPTPFSGRTRDQQRQRQRDLFLRRVEQTRDDKRWEGRSEEILRCDHFAQQRRWQEAYETQTHETSEITDADAGLVSSAGIRDQPLSSYELTRSRSPFEIDSDPPDSEVDLMAQQERGELEEWVMFFAQTENPESEMQSQQHQHHQQENDTQTTTDYDDDEYDEVFLELIDQRPPSQEPAQQTDVEMSMS